MNYLYYDYAISKICVVTDKETIFHETTSLNRYINHLCLENGSSLEGRKDSFRHMFPRKKHIPIYVHANLFLVPFPDKRFINYFSIRKVKQSKNEFEIFFKDNTSLKTDRVSQMTTTLLHASQFIKIIRAS